MLRLVALALLLANLLYFGWTLGWLDAVVGIRAQGDREPQRLQRQLRPELIELSAVGAAPAASPADSVEIAATATANSASAPASAAASAAHASAASATTAATATAAAAPPSAVAKAAAKVASAAADEAFACLEAGPFAAADLGAAEAAIRTAVPAAKWTQRRVAGSGEWMIYMGPYADEAWIERKKAELSRIRGGLAYEAVGPTAQLGRGISLGRFDSQAAAAKQLEDYRPRGIRTARVVQSGDGPGKTFLRIAKADPALVELLGSVKWPEGQDGFKSCASSR